MSENDLITLIADEDNEPIAINEKVLLSMIAAHIRGSTIKQLEAIASRIESDIKVLSCDEISDKFNEVWAVGDFSQVDWSVRSLDKLVAAYVHLLKGEHIDLRLYLENV